ncbi:unnamed protein product, partial [Discosporangium mesarthrocarpum]
VFAGSADELDSQQGMAHLVEHITYMGSRKRSRLFGTGSQTNAYTDFHHTVFYASCPVMTPPGWGRRTPMLGRALGALCDVLEAVVEESRLEKERSAVLSELTMVNTIDYRMECQILAALHAENQLSRRFPIGKDHLIRNWSSKDVLEFHRAHYRPENAMVYCIGDLDLNDCEEQIRKTFGHLGGQGGKPDAQAFSLHVFAKRPIEPVSTLGDLRRSVMKRIALAALQIRLSVNSRTDPPFLSIEFNQLDSPREGCAVCYLDMTADASKWKQAVKLAVREIRRLGMYGLSEGELTRFSSALLTDARQLASQGNRLSNAELPGHQAGCGEPHPAGRYSGTPYNSLGQGVVWGCSTRLERLDQAAGGGGRGSGYGGERDHVSDGGGCIRVNMGQHKYESQRGQLRIVLPGGRQLESALGRGSVAIGARTMQEGGTFGNWVREQVELFCIDHLIMVTVDANDEYLYIDLAFPTTKV